MKLNKFYVIATPIGNIQEVNNRMKNAIANCNYLFCEDTRVTQKLLHLMKQNTPWPKLISYHKFNEKNKLFELINLIENYTCGLISDAGYPTISDPGNLIISTIRDKLKNIHIEVINCANAAICALTGSGLNTSNFYFHGFLSKKNNEAIKELSKLITINTTIILYESVYRIVNTLNLMNKFFMDKKICVVRELTKQNETYYFGTINEILKKLTLKGEFVILIDNSKTITKIKQEFENKHIEEIMELISLGLKLKNACKFVAKKYNLDNSKLYAYFQSKK